MVELYGSKVFMILRAVPQKTISKVIGYVLRKYKRYGLAELVEKGWDWKGDVHELDT